MNNKIVTELEQGVLKITFPYNPDTIHEVKGSIIGRAWDSKGKYWYAPLSLINLKKLKELGFVLATDLETKLVNKNTEQPFQNKPLKIPGLKRKLFPFQEKGVQFLEAKNGRGLLADEMGLGKTIQALAWLQLHPEKRPVLIIVPASLKLNWVREIQITMSNPGVIQLLSGTKPKRIHADIVIINYDILKDWVAHILQWNPQVVITDEAHYYKNNKSLRTKAIKKIVRKRQHIIALSGTPIVSRPIEFYNVLSIIQPKLFSNQWQYAMRYCAAKNNGYGWDFSGASHTDELFSIINNVVMIRRKKSEVLKELPAKLFDYVPISISNRKEYNGCSIDFINWLKETKGAKTAEKASHAEVLVQLNYLKMLAAKGKLAFIKKWIHDFLDGSNEKLVVFGIHKIMIDELLHEFNDVAVKLDGSLSISDKQKAVKLFQERKEVRLFIGNIQAAGVGITLTAASKVAFIEFPWNPGELVQAEDRCHRIGQKNTVNIYYLFAEKTIDEKMAKLLDGKRKVIDSILDGKETEAINLFDNLLASYL